ncbi:MAG: cell division protein FtsB [Steroidobacteraceae bacterium]
MRWLVVALVAVVMLVQYRLWMSPDGVREVMQLREAVAVQQAENDELRRRNGELAAEVRDLKQGYVALEERARADLGLIGRDETYYQVVPNATPAAAPAPQSVPAAPEPTRTAAR